MSTVKIYERVVAPRVSALQWNKPGDHHLECAPELVLSDSVGCDPYRIVIPTYNGIEFTLKHLLSRINPDNTYNLYVMCHGHIAAYYPELSQPCTNPIKGKDMTPEALGAWLSTFFSLRHTFFSFYDTHHNKAVKLIPGDWIVYDGMYHVMSDAEFSMRYKEVTNASN